MADPKLKTDTILLWGAAALGAFLLWRGTSKYEGATRPPLNFGGDVVVAAGATSTAEEDGWGDKWAIFEDSPPAEAMGMRRGGGPKFLLVMAWASLDRIDSHSEGFETFEDAAAELEWWNDGESA